MLDEQTCWCCYNRVITEQLNVCVWTLVSPAPPTGWDQRWNDLDLGATSAAVCSFTSVCSPIHCLTANGCMLSRLLGLWCLAHGCLGSALKLCRGSPLLCGWMDIHSMVFGKMKRVIFSPNTSALREQLLRYTNSPTGSPHLCRDSNPEPLD